MYKYITIVILALGVSGGIYASYKHVQNLASELEATKIEAARANQALVTIKTQIAVLEQQQQEFSQETQAINIEYNNVRNELESLRGREDVVLARPTLVERMINRSFEEQQQRLVCLTEGSCTQN